MSCKNNRLVVILFVISIVGIISSFLSYHNSIEQVERENFKELLRVHTKIKLSTTRDYISDMVYDLHNIAQMTKDYDSIWDSNVKEILNTANQMDEFDFTAVVDKDGNGYVQSGETFNIAEKDYFKSAMQGIVSFSEVKQSKAMPGKFIQIFTCPIYSRQHVVTGVTLGLVDLEDINKVIAHKNEETEGNLYIIDSNGNYISRFQMKKDNIKYMNFWDELKELKIKSKDITKIREDFENKKEGEFSFYENGEHRYGCYMPIGTRNWQILYTVKDTAVDKKLNTIFRIDIKNTIFTGICHLVLLFSVSFYFKNVNKEIKNAHRAVNRNIELLHTALDYSNQIIFEYNQVTREIIPKTNLQNSFYQQIDKKISPESIIEQNIIASESIKSFLELFELIKTKEYVKANIQVHSNSKSIWYLISLYNVYKEDRIVDTVGFLEDITELKRIQNETKQKLEVQDTLIAKALLYAKADMKSNCLVEMNGQESQISFDEFLNGEVIPYVHPEHKVYVLQELSIHTLQNKFHQGIDTTEIQFKMIFNNREIWVSCMVYYNLQIHSNLILIINDIDEKKKQEIMLKNQAERDGLTGLYNASTARNKIEEALSQRYLSDNKQVFVLVDLDNYKMINDTFGHEVGNQVLLEVSDSLKKMFRSSDIIGRIGGDEFVILLRNLRDYRDSERLIAELCQMICKTYVRNGKSVTLSASIGVAKVPVDGNTFKELF